MNKNIPKVTIVGRPNVGKSTLINRICGKAEAIVHHKPMITRDRKYYKTDWNGKVFHLLDTGGIDSRSKDRMDAQVFRPADHIDPGYGRALRRAAKNGIEVLAFDVRIDLQGIGLNQKPLMTRGIPVHSMKNPKQSYCGLMLIKY